MRKGREGEGDAEMIAALDKILAGIEAFNQAFELREAAENFEARDGAVNLKTYLVGVRGSSRSLSARLRALAEKRDKQRFTLGEGQRLQVRSSGVYLLFILKERPRPGGQEFYHAVEVDAQHFAEREAGQAKLSEVMVYLQRGLDRQIGR